MVRFRAIATALAGTILAAGSGCFAIAANDSCESTLPSALRSEITRHFKEWDLVRVSDLDEEDQALWSKAHGSACPGLAAGNFSGSYQLQFAVLLRKPRPSQRIQLLFAEEDKSGRFRIRSLLRQRVDRLSVVFATTRKGLARQTNDRLPSRFTNDVIVLETIEAGATGYYITQGTFKSVVLSE